MEVKQIATLMNSVTNELLGKSDIVAEDLSNIVDVGKEVFDSTAVDNYAKSLVNQIGKVIFVNRPYKGNVPSVLMDSWEYGSVLEKISADIPEAEENDSWDLKDGTEYKQDIFHAPKVAAKFYNNKVTFEIPMSFTDRQLKESFTSASQLNGFLSMIENTVDKSLTIKTDSLIMRTINNFIGETLKNEFKADDTTNYSNFSKVTSMKAVNLLKLYNAKFNTKLTAEQAITAPEFIRYAVFTINLYRDRLTKISTLFNIGGKERFTTTDKLHLVLLSEVKQAADIYLQSDTFHNEFTSIQGAETVPYWQASGKDYSFANTSDIHISTTSGTEVVASGIIGVMFDSDALGVSNLDRRVTTNYNAKGEFYNNYYKFDSGYFNDENENFVVFYVA